MRTLVHKLKELPPFRHPTQELEELSLLLNETSLFSHDRETLAYDMLRAYHDMEDHILLDPHYRMDDEERLGFLKHLQEEEHDVIITQLMKILAERGLKNTLGIVADMHNAHLEDDVHRALVAYLLSEEALPDQLRNLKENATLSLFECRFKQALDHEQSSVVFQRLIAQALSLTHDPQALCALEIAVPERGQQLSLYLALGAELPSHALSYLQSNIPELSFTEHTNDYNIFSFAGAFSAREVTKFPRGPLVKSSFKESLKRLLASACEQGKGFALQWVIQAHNAQKIASYGQSLDQGEAHILSEMHTSSHYLVNIRAMSSAATKREADHMIGELEKALCRYWGLTDTEQLFVPMKPEAEEDLLRQYVYRFFAEKKAQNISLKTLGEMLAIR